MPQHQDTASAPCWPEEATEDEIRAAALQYVRKISGFRAPAAQPGGLQTGGGGHVAGATA
ncbi:DUF2277 domain-containing protein [Streptomyces thinghirensis]|nr:DUF2277 domain-containing protein [Streptomyces thinghirensis]